MQRAAWECMWVNSGSHFGYLRMQMASRHLSRGVQEPNRHRTLKSREKPGEEEKWKQVRVLNIMR